MRIGLEAARGITVAALTRAEDDRLDESGLDPDRYWRWLLAIGLLAEAFSTHDGLSPDELQTAFTAGLLHQMGRLSDASRSPERYQQVMAMVRAGYKPLDAERQVFGVQRWSSAPSSLATGRCPPRYWTRSSPPKAPRPARSPLA